MSVALSLALLHFVWQGALLIAVVWVLERAVDSQGAATRYVVLVGGLAAALLTALSTFERQFERVVEAGSGAGSGMVATTTGFDLLALAYAIGVITLGAHMAWQFAQIRRLRASGVPLRELRGKMSALAERLGVTRFVTVVESVAVDAPIVVGWLRPMILLPLGLATHLQPAALEALLAHELAHVRRFDPLVVVLQRAAVVVLFFHPLVWWLSRRIDTVREEACDDVVVDTLKAPLIYARALVELEDGRRAQPAFALGAVHPTPRGNLMKRIQRITQRKPKQQRWSIRSAGAGLGIAAVLAMAVVVARPAQSQASEAVDQGVSIAWLPERVMDHEAAISKAALRHGVDPNLLAIMVLLESGGEPTARSPRGARGLVQVMPKTAEQIAKARGLDGHREARLDDPAYNLDLASWYLAQQLDRFGKGRSVDEGIAWAAAAYNAGPTRVELVLAGKATLSEETRTYRARVAELWAKRNDVPR